jgi:acetyl-CoA acyltransferase
MTINRFCSSGLQSIAMAAERIMVGGAEVIVAGGTESMSMVPMGGNKVAPNPWLMDHYPDAYLGMGLTAENLGAKKYNITREQADEFSYASHQKALAAIAAGKFKDEIVPVEVRTNGRLQRRRPRSAARKPPRLDFDTDEGPRADTSLEALARLKPAFHVAWHGDRRQQFADERRRRRLRGHERRTRRAMGAKPLARFLAFATAGYAPEEMGSVRSMPFPRRCDCRPDARSDRRDRTQ